MNKFLLSFVLLFSVFFLKAQTKFSFGGFYSSPLHQFCIDDYSDGVGFQLGIGKQINIYNKWAIEGGLNWQWGKNGSEDVDLLIGNYDLSNKFFNWQLKLNVLKDLGRFTPYAGAHVGNGKYYTNEYLNFEDTQQDGSEFYEENLYSNSTLQYGIQLGTYVKMNRNIDFNFGVSINKGDTKVKYIDYDTYSFDGSEIDYVEKNSKPFMILLNAEIVIKIFKGDLKTSSPNSSSAYDDSYDDQPATCPKRVWPYYSNSGSSSSSSSSNESSNTHYNNKEEPKLIKNGKTPVGYK